MIRPSRWEVTTTGPVEPLPLRDIQALLNNKPAVRPRRVKAVVVVGALALAAGFGFATGPCTAKQDAKTVQVETTRRADIEVYDDGSAVQYYGDVEIKTFPKGTFDTTATK